MAAVLVLWPAPYLMANCQAVVPCSGASSSATSARPAQMDSDACCCGGLERYCEEANACAAGQACALEPTLTIAAEAGSVAHIAVTGARATRLGADSLRVRTRWNWDPPNTNPTPSFIALHVLLI